MYQSLEKYISAQDLQSSLAGQRSLHETFNRLPSSVRNELTEEFNDIPVAQKVSFSSEIRNAFNKENVSWFYAGNAPAHCRDLEDKIVSGLSRKDLADISGMIDKRTKPYMVMDKILNTSDYFTVKGGGDLLRMGKYSQTMYSGNNMLSGDPQKLPPQLKDLLKFVEDKQDVNYNMAAMNRMNGELQSGLKQVDKAMSNTYYRSDELDVLNEDPRDQIAPNFAWNDIDEEYDRMREEEFSFRR